MTNPTTYPRVHVSAAIEKFESRTFGRVAYESPGVEVFVDFDYGDHHAALAALDQAVESIVLQVRKATGDDELSVRTTLQV